MSEKTACVASSSMLQDIVMQKKDNVKRRELFVWIEKGRFSCEVMLESQRSAHFLALYGIVVIKMEFKGGLLKEK